MKSKSSNHAKSPLILCVIPAERSALAALIMGAGGTPVIDITASKRGPMPKGAWIRTRNRRTAPGKGPVLLAGGNHRQPIRGRETWLEVTEAVKPPKGFAGIVYRGAKCGGLHGSKPLSEFLKNLDPSVPTLIENGFWPTDMKGLVESNIHGVVLKEALLHMPELGLPPNLSALIQRANKSFIHQVEQIQVLAPPLSPGLQSLASGANWWKTCNEWFEKDAPDHLTTPLGFGALMENASSIKSIPALIAAIQTELTNPTTQMQVKQNEIPQLDVQPTPKADKPTTEPRVEIAKSIQEKQPEKGKEKSTSKNESHQQKPRETFDQPKSQEEEQKEQSRPREMEPIAIVGMGCRFPSANTLDDYWQNILNRHCAIDEVPRTRWDERLYFDPNPKAPDRTYSKIGAFIKNFSFDPKVYRIPPSIAQHVDPVQQIALSSAADALTDAGYLLDSKVDRARIAVILGNSMGGELGDDYTLRSRFPEVIEALQQSSAYRALTPKVQDQLKSELQDRYKSQLPEVTADAMPGELSNVIAGRVANAFNLHGPSYTIDAACASSMAAIQAAVKGLRDHEFDMALSGGADRSMGAPTYIKFAKIGALSATGSRPFDQSANGFVMGEGCGILALKRLSDAKRDGDKIYAVIEGVGASSDGKGKGITAPNPKGQRLALQRAYQSAEIDPLSVELIECHGTSTVVGDKVELETLSQFMGQGERLIRVGSVKSNIGHLKSAAGAASIIKAALAIHHGVFPPTANCRSPRKDIDMRGLHIQREKTEWTSDTRRAGVSAFGFGGANFHLCLSNDFKSIGKSKSEAAHFSRIQSQPLEIIGRTLPPEIWTSSAKSKTELIAKLSTNDGRILESDPFRIAILSEDTEKDISTVSKLIEKTQNVNLLRNKGIFIEEEPVEGEIALLFTGQGSQYIEMGMALAERYPVVQDTFDEADAILEPLFNKKLTDYIRRNPSELESEQFSHLRETQIAQPATLTIDVAIFRLLKSFGLETDRVAGHSLGEYAACVAAEVMTFKDALLAVCARGKGMASIKLDDPGAMASIGTHPDKVKALLKEIDGYVIAANLNAPSQTVIAGETKAMNTAISNFRDKGFMVQPLAVSHAFHTKLVEPATSPLRKALQDIEILPPSIPINSNVDGELYPSDADEIRELLAKQVASPVQWIKQIENLYRSGVRVFIECGPKRALSGMVASILKRKKHRILSTNDPRKGDLKSFHECIAALSALNRLPGHETVLPKPPSQIENQSMSIQKQPIQRPASALTVVCSGASVGLPGGEEVFAPDNVERLLSGENRIQALDVRSQDRIISKRIVRVQKNASTGQGEFIAVKRRDDVIKLAGKKSHFDLTEDYGVDKELAKALDITTQLAFAAGIEALLDAKIPLIKAKDNKGSAPNKFGGYKLPAALQEETGVIFASAFPGYANFAKHIRRNGDDGQGQFDRRFLFQVLAMGHSQFAQFIGAKGPNTHVNAACASTTQAIGIAHDWIRQGRAKRVIVLAADDVTSPEMMEWIGSGFLAVGAATTEANVKDAALPFDERRHGMILGMGAVGLVIEEETEVKKRGLHGIAKLIASHFSNSAYHNARIQVDHISTEMKAFIRKATANQGISASDFAKSCLFVSHETFTPARGGSASAEIKGLQSAFEDAAKTITITNTKGYTGHSMAASIEDVVAIKALQYGMAPPIPNLLHPDPELGELSLADGSRFKGRYSLRIAAGFGSQIAFLAWEKVDEEVKRTTDDGIYNQWLEHVCDAKGLKLNMRSRTLIAIQNENQTEGVGDQYQSNRSVLDAVFEFVVETTGISADDIDLQYEFEADLGIDPIALSTKIRALKLEFNKEGPLPDHLFSPNLNLESVIAWLNDVEPTGKHPTPNIQEKTPIPTPPQQVDVGAVVLQAIAEHTGYDISDLEFEYELEADLGIDTVKQAEVFAHLRDAFHLSPTLEMGFDGAPTIQDVTDWIIEQTKPTNTKTPAHIPEKTSSESSSEKQIEETPDPIVPTLPEPLKTPRQKSKRSRKVSRWMKRKRQMQLTTAENNRELPKDRMKEPEYFAKLDALLAADELFQQHVQEIMPSNPVRPSSSEQKKAIEKTYPFPINSVPAEAEPSKPVSETNDVTLPNSNDQENQTEDPPTIDERIEENAEENALLVSNRPETMSHSNPDSFKPFDFDEKETMADPEPDINSEQHDLNESKNTVEQDASENIPPKPIEEVEKISTAPLSKKAESEFGQDDDGLEAQQESLEETGIINHEDEVQISAVLDEETPQQSVQNAFIDQTSFIENAFQEEPKSPINQAMGSQASNSQTQVTNNPEQHPAVQEDHSELSLEQILDYAISESDSEMDQIEQDSIEHFSMESPIATALDEEPIERLPIDDTPVNPIDQGLDMGMTESEIELEPSATSIEEIQEKETPSQPKKISFGRQMAAAVKAHRKISGDSEEEASFNRTRAIDLPVSIKLLRPTSVTLPIDASRKSTPQAVHIIGQGNLAMALKKALTAASVQISKDAEVVVDLSDDTALSWQTAKSRLESMPKRWLSVGTTEASSLQQVLHTGGRAGLSKALGREWRHCQSASITVDGELDGQVKTILSMLQSEWPAKEVHFSDKSKSGTAYDELNWPKHLRWDELKTIVLIGGGRGITAEIAKGFARRGPCKLILLGRTMPSQEPLDRESAKKMIKDKLLKRGKKATPALINASLNLLTNSDEVRRTIHSLKTMGADVEFIRCNVVEANEVKAAFTAIEAKAQRIDIVVHGAGVERSQLLAKKSLQDFKSVFTTKALAAVSILDSIPEETLFVSMGSIAGRLGNPGQTDYAAANDAVAHLCKRRQAALHVAWTAWDGPGMTSKPGMKALLEKNQIELLPPIAAADALVSLTQSNIRGEVMVAGNLSNFPLDCAHPFLKDMQLCGRKRRFTIDNSIFNSKWMADHSLQGRPLLPGVIALELMTGAALSCHPKLHYCGATSVEFKSALKWHGKDDVLIFVETETTNLNSVRCIIRSIRKAATGKTLNTIHFSAVIHLTDMQPLEDLPEIIGTDYPLTSKDIYSRFFHGPSFQVIHSVFEIASDCLSAEGRVDHSPIHINLNSAPLTLESAFQAAGLHHLSLSNQVALPLGFEELEFLEAPKENEPLLIAVVKRGDSYDVDIDSEDVAILRLRGLRMVNLGPNPPEKEIKPPPGGWTKGKQITSEISESEEDSFSDSELNDLSSRGNLKRIQDRMAGRTAAKKLISRFVGRDPRDILIVNDELGRPIFDKGIDISISHSNGIGHAGILQEGRIGVDIESIELRSAAFLKHWFTPLERKISKDNSKKQTAIWALKEAMSKALGLGFRLHPASIKIIELHSFHAKLKLSGNARKRLVSLGYTEINARVRTRGKLMTACIVLGNGLMMVDPSQGAVNEKH